MKANDPFSIFFGPPPKRKTKAKQRPPQPVAKPDPMPVIEPDTTWCAPPGEDVVSYESLLPTVGPVCSEKLQPSTPQRREPDPWGLSVLAENDKQLPKPIGKCVQRYKPDEYEIWKLEQTRKLGGLMPQRGVEPRLQHKKETDETTGN